MAWSQVTAGGSDTTWSGITAGGSDTTWSGVTAGGSDTTWSGITAGGSDTTWDAAQGTPNNNSWIPYGRLLDAFDGRDFQPRVWDRAPLKLDNTRPIAVWADSTVTSSNFTTEGAP